MAFWIPLAAAAISAAGAIQQGRQSAASAKKQMMFQESMSNTAHQRQVADLRAAGLNPILSARLGGASTPSGAQQQVIPNIGGSAANSALNAYNTVAQVQEREKHAELMAQQKSTAKMQEQLFQAQGYEALERSTRHVEDARLSRARANVTETELAGAKNWETLQKEIGPWLNLLRSKGLGPLASKILDTFKNAMLGATKSSAKSVTRGAR